MSGITPFNPDSWMDVVALLGMYTIVTGVPLLLAGRKVARNAKTTGRQVTEIHEQTVNDHGQELNMREQLDRMEEAQRKSDERQRKSDDRQAEFQRTVMSEISGLRKDIGRVADAAVDDRAMHHKDVERIDDDIERLEKRIT